MKFPEIEKKHILEALKHIDENGVPPHNRSTKNELVSKDGKTYPPKYVIAVARYLAKKTETISVDEFNSNEANKYLEGEGFTIQTVQQKKNQKDIDAKTEEQQGIVQQRTRYKNPYSSMLITSKNMIFRGAPGTGKSYLAKEIAADIISNGSIDKYDELNDEQRKQVEFVQFHPSYDYSDFVEGLRPKVNADGSMGFELRDGVFKRFVERARKNYEDSQKSQEIIKKEISIQEAIEKFFSDIKYDVTEFNTVNGNKFVITDVNEENITIFIPGNASSNKINLKLAKLKKMLESEQSFEKIKDVKSFFGNSVVMQEHSYYFALYKKIKDKMSSASKIEVKQEELKYIFIIDEINRGEISKIFGELFYSIDPGYRGRAGEISTQYSNLHSDPNEKFYIPENVYIIGTMNDIDRSVDSFDFAMRRRFRFVELRAGDRLKMLDSLEDDNLKEQAKNRMTALNNAIADVEDLNENYQIGAAYFLKLKTIDFDQLWTDYLYPLLQEYIRGMYDEDGIMDRFTQAYGYSKSSEDAANETVENQG